MENINFTNEEDLLLLKKISNQEHYAFDKLFQKYWKLAYSTAFKRLQNREDAKDIVQDIFLSIWKNRLSLNIQNFQAYLSVSIKNRVINKLAKSKNESPFFDYFEEIVQTNCKGDDSLLQKEFMKNYHQFIDSLSPQRQKIFRMRHQDDLSTADISRLLDMNRKTVQNHLGKAANLLKVHITKTNPLLIFLYLFT